MLVGSLTSVPFLAQSHESCSFILNWHSGEPEYILTSFQNAFREEPTVTISIIVVDEQSDSVVNGREQKLLISVANRSTLFF